MFLKNGGISVLQNDMVKIIRGFLQVHRFSTAYPSSNAALSLTNPLPMLYEGVFKIFRTGAVSYTAVAVARSTGRW
jgi:hypothetical protein